MQQAGRVTDWTGFDYLDAELDVLEYGVRALLAAYGAVDGRDESARHMMGLVVTEADLARTFDEAASAPVDEALAEFRRERLEAERHLAELVSEARSLGAHMPLALLVERLGLDDWERRCVVLALSVERDVRCESWYAYLNDDVTQRVPTAELALTLLCDDDAQRDAARARLSDSSVLRRFVLRAWDDNAGGAWRSSLRQPLRLDPRIVGFLLELEDGDARLDGYADAYGAGADGGDRPQPLLCGDELPGRARLFVGRERGRADGRLPFVQLWGAAGAGKTLTARHLCAGLGQPLLELRLDRLAGEPERMAERLRHAVREALLTDAAIAFDEGDRPPDDGELRQRLLRETERAVEAYRETAARPLLLWMARTQRRPEEMPLPGDVALLDMEVPLPDADTRLKLWRRAAEAGAGEAVGGGAGGGERDTASAELLPALADKYRFTPGQIVRTQEQAARLAELDGRALPDLADFEAASRSQVRHRLAALAQKLTPARSWDDLILPTEAGELLREACARHKHRETVYGRWGFGRKLPYGRGLSMLFAGPPGTGKTMAAEIVAAELGLELYRIDLSRVVSKYIGETEKNLREVFAEAENSGSILFFDEGDSLFGKRTEVKDSNDRFANMEAAYLLQRIEAFEGVSVLATNLLNNMDEAFLRRMQVVVKFPFPEAAERERILRAHLPPEAPVEDDLDLPFLAARIELAGGHLKNIVVAAAFLAAAQGQPIGMNHLVKAARQEMHKTGKIMVKEAFAPYA